MGRRTKTRAADQLQLAPGPRTVRLDLACGQTPRDGFEGVDLYAPNAAHRVDLFKFPFPWETSTVDEVHCSHFIEHLPCREVESRDLSKKVGGVAAKAILGKDFLFAFMDECWRILKPEGAMRVIVPSATNTRAFQDPTHRRFITAATFLYFSREWRRQQALDHYRVDCDFVFSAVPIVSVEETLLSDEAQRRRFNECWNVVLDWQADLIAKKV